ncbi:MAG: glycosyltransferase family 1 protein [Chloroflexi bacterium]|nr:glycosyltransferase family 1 protein [Chloroflexota bacterium]
MIAHRDFIILSTQDWSALPTRKHRWARNWARQGDRVLYVEQQMHWAGWLAAIGSEFWRPFRCLRGPQLVEPNLWVFTLPIVLPFFQMSVAINRLNNFFLLPVLRWAMRRVGFTSPILWAYTPHSADFVGALGESISVYECVDEFSASKGLVYGPAIAAMERELIAKVDQVIVTAPALLESKRPLARRIETVPNGVDVEHFARASRPETTPHPAVAALPKPVIGFIGGVQYWVDFDLTAHAARAHPEWSFAFVGPVEPLARIDKVRGLPNVHFLGKQPYAIVPQFVAGFDVCINPYVLDGVGENVDPLKLYDYLASGKPVVSTDIPAARRFADVIRLARTADEFTRALEAALADPGDAAARQRMAADHSWESRFQRVQAIVERLSA